MAFKHISETVDGTIKYIDDRRKGLIKSCRTGYKKLDRALLDGIEYGSIISIGGRPSVGKTAYSSCLLRGILANNPLNDMEVLDFNWEMSSRSLLLRDLSADCRESYKNIISAGEKPVDDEQMESYKNILNGYKKFPIFFEEEPKSAKEFADMVKRKRDASKGKKLVVRIDHTVLAKQTASEANQVAMLQNLLSEAGTMKKESDIIFIMLTQLNRECEARQQDGTNDAYLRQSDCFGGDAVAQFSEAVILLNRPAKYEISYYGRRPNGMVAEPNSLFGHLVKSRNSEPDLILRYEAMFDTMRMREI